MPLFQNTKKALFLVNPTAGKLKAKAALFDLISIFNRNGCQTTVQITQGKGHAIMLAQQAAKQGFDLVVCCGGDGTLNETVSGMMAAEQRLPVGYIPAGSTNDFANSMGISTNLSEAAEQIVKYHPVLVDVGSFGPNRYFTYIASFGVFTSVSYNTPQSVKNVLGHLAYLLEGVKDLTKIQSHHVVAQTKDQIYEDDFIFGAVGNTTSVGGIVKIAPNLVGMNDGLFEILLIKMPKSLNDLHKIVMGLTLSDFKDEMFLFFKADEVHFTTSPELSWTLDGEYAPGQEGQPTVRNLHNAISMYV